METFAFTRAGKAWNENSFFASQNFCFVLADSVDVVDNGIYTVISDELVKKVLIMSDDYSLVFDTFKFLTEKELLNEINCESDIAKIYERLYTLQEQGEGALNYPRMKKRNDATVVAMMF